MLDQIRSFFSSSSELVSTSSSSAFFKADTESHSIIGSGILSDFLASQSFGCAISILLFVAHDGKWLLYVPPQGLQKKARMEWAFDIVKSLLGTAGK